MAFLRYCLMFYRHPNRFIAELREIPAPGWGLLAVVLRGLMDGLLLYLPISLMGRTPPERSYLPFFPTDTYYQTLIFLGPLVFLVYWLFSAALMHVILRLTRHRSDIDLLLNLNGITSLTVAIVILVWDWGMLVSGWGNQYILGISHLVLDIYGITISVLALKRLLGVPVWLGLLLGFLAIVTWLPFGIMFMRSPL